MAAVLGFVMMVSWCLGKLLVAHADVKFPRSALVNANVPLTRAGNIEQYVRQDAPCQP